MVKEFGKVKVGEARDKIEIQKYRARACEDSSKRMFAVFASTGGFGGEETDKKRRFRHSRICYSRK